MALKAKSKKTGKINKKSKIIAGVCVLLAVVLGVTGILLSLYGNETACYDFGKDRVRDMIYPSITERLIGRH